MEKNNRKTERKIVENTYLVKNMIQQHMNEI